MKKTFVFASLIFFGTVLFFSTDLSQAQDHPPPIRWKNRKDCCGDLDCIKAEVKIRGWDKDSRKFVVEVNDERVLLNEFQVGYTNKESAYCFKSSSSACWKKIGETQSPLVKRDCVLCAIERRDFVFQEPEPGPRVRKILTRRIPRETQSDLIQKLRLLPVMPRGQCASCHPLQKEIMKKWTEAWFGRKLPEIFGFRPHP